MNISTVEKYISELKNIANEEFNETFEVIDNKFILKELADEYKNLVKKVAAYYRLKEAQKKLKNDAGQNFINALEDYTNQSIDIAKDINDKEKRISAIEVESDEEYKKIFNSKKQNKRVLIGDKYKLKVAEAKRRKVREFDEFKESNLDVIEEYERLKLEAAGSKESLDREAAELARAEIKTEITINEEQPEVKKEIETVEDELRAEPIVVEPIVESNEEINIAEQENPEVVIQTVEQPEIEIVQSDVDFIDQSNPTVEIQQPSEGIEITPIQQTVDYSYDPTVVIEQPTVDVANDQLGVLNPEVQETHDDNEIIEIIPSVEAETNEVLQPAPEVVAEPEMVNVIQPVPEVQVEPEMVNVEQPAPEVIAEPEMVNVVPAAPEVVTEPEMVDVIKKINKVTDNKPYTYPNATIKQVGEFEATAYIMARIKEGKQPFTSLLLRVKNYKGNINSFTQEEERKNFEDIERDIMQNTDKLGDIDKDWLLTMLYNPRQNYIIVNNESVR